MSLSADDYHAITQFLYREARLLDAHAFVEWETLWTEDGVYWVPARHDGDAAHDVALVHADRAGIARRVGRMKSNAMYSGDPRPQVARVIGNVEAQGAGEDVQVHATFNLTEHRTRGPDTWLRTWAGRTEYRLRRVDGQWRMALKKVYLLGSDTEVPAMGFML